MICKLDGGSFRKTIVEALEKVSYAKGLRIIGNHDNCFTKWCASASDGFFFFREVFWWAFYLWQFNYHNFVHVHMQPQLNEPPRTSQVGDRLILSESGWYLMKQVVNWPQKMLAEGDMIASSQIFCQLEIIACWTNCFTTEDKFLKPHIEKSSVLSDRYRSGVHILTDVLFPSADTLCFNLKGSFFLTDGKIYREHRCSSQ